MAPGEDGSVTLARCVHARHEAAEIVRRTPVLSSASFSERCGGAVSFKAECLQRTGSFKLRGALSKLHALAPGTRRAGVVAGSAGNHAQALAFAARHARVPCTVFMPEDAARTKIEAVRAFGAEVHPGGTSVDDSVALAIEHAEAARAVFVHPFDDLDVIAGQAAVGLEILEDVPDLRTLVVPIGGGGLAAGVGAVVRWLRPEVEIVGVQAVACAPYTSAPVPSGALRTLADGIAVKRPGQITRPLVERVLDRIVTVEESDIAEAMVMLLERSKLVVEGAGAASAAALLAGTAQPAETGATVAILSGGNVDTSVLVSIAAQQETSAGRRARFFARVPDSPGALAALLSAVAGARVNVIAVEHVRDGVALGVRETGVAVTVEARGPRVVERLLADLCRAGFAIDDEALLLNDGPGIGAPMPANRNSALTRAEQL